MSGSLKFDDLVRQIADLLRVLLLYPELRSSPEAVELVFQMLKRLVSEMNIDALDPLCTGIAELESALNGHDSHWQRCLLDDIDAFLRN